MAASEQWMLPNALCPKITCISVVLYFIDYCFYADIYIYKHIFNK